jgi:hypothetical protein
MRHRSLCIRCSLTVAECRCPPIPTELCVDCDFNPGLCDEHDEGGIGLADAVGEFRAGNPEPVTLKTVRCPHCKGAKVEVSADRERATCPACGSWWQLFDAGDVLKPFLDGTMSALERAVCGDPLTTEHLTQPDPIAVIQQAGQRSTKWVRGELHMESTPGAPSRLITGLSDSEAAAIGLGLMDEQGARPVLKGEVGERLTFSLDQWRQPFTPLPPGSDLTPGETTSPPSPRQPTPGLGVYACLQVGTPVPLGHGSLCIVVAPSMGEAGAAFHAKLVDAEKVIDGATYRILEIPMDRVGVYCVGFAGLS